MATVNLSSSAPPPPPDADFAIYIDFDKSMERPQRVFQALDGLISAFERLDKTLARSIDPSIEPLLLLEDIESGSIKVWLRDKLVATEDQALYELDWKPMVGRYLLASKYAFIEWVNNSEERGRPGSLSDLRKRILELAHQTEVRRIPAYGVPSAAELLESTKDVARALSPLNPHDRVKYISDAGSSDFTVGMAWDDLDIEQLAIRETISSPPAPMILAVKRPDYLGASQWEFRHGKRSIRGKIEDAQWLEQFQTRRIDVRPGDALRCLVKHEVNYGFDNEVVSESYVIVSVQQVLENEFKQSDLFDN
ncbi:hypothetical protein [Ollibium composti]|uniref:Uncharacterized protein n=1 Tax=Ollibium composti TaxID=2675109 RepID=A0ABY2Q5Z1_9HYPH|nr:hypothetical protein [Mesorhizobium composti]THF55808.1 hypothetical protein E6C48_17225 [Mesorhizobium composti]